MEAFFKKCLVIIMLLLLPVPSLATEAIKFRYALSVYSDDAGGSIKHPESVTCGENSEFIIADTGNNRLVKYAFQRGELAGGTEIRLPELSYPLKVQANSNGDIFALDGRKRRIVIIATDGSFKGYLDLMKGPRSGSIVPRSFVIDKNDNIYVLDILSGRVLVLDPGGSYRRHVDFPEEYGFISDLAVGPAGNILLIDSIRSTVFSSSQGEKTFSPLSENLKEHASFPTGITTDERGFIYLTDTNGSRIVILGQDGSFLGQQVSLGWTEGALYYPTQLCINGKGEIFIADRSNSRVQIFTVDK
jgi:sugar lactone lactonase YvrE